MTEQHVHLMFGMSEQGVMKAALHKAGIRHSHKVLSFNDWFSYGPLASIDTTDGERERISWLSQRLSNYGRLYTYNPDHQIGTVIKAIEAIPDGSSVTIWHGEHTHDQIGLRFAAYLLRNRDVQIALNNAAASYISLSTHEKNEQVSAAYSAALSPVSLAQLKAVDFIPMLKGLDQREIISDEDRAKYSKEWEEVSAESMPLKLWENKQFKYSGDDGLDAVLGEVISEQAVHFPDQYVPASKVVGEVLVKLHHYHIRKDFLEYRLRSLIESKRLQFKGAPGQLHRYSVKIG
ncbi:DUF1835 domain-containing protein [Neobacillus mesonae]|nr:DUF1835 domain-containing protein [Neobacillus mesonae]